MTNLTKQIIYAALVTGLALSCGKEEEEEVTVDPGDMPQAGSINLSTMGADSSTALKLAGDECGSASTHLGWLMGLGIDAACHSSGFAANILLGSKDGDHNGDGSLTCDDYTYAEATDGVDSGILTSLICDENFRSQRIVSYYGDADGSAIGIDFNDADSSDSFDATGSWLAGDAASYPAEIRMFSGSTLDALTGILDVQLDSADKGNLAVRYGGLNVQSTFNNISDASSCESNPSSDTCYKQTLQLYTTESTDFEGFNIEVYANDKNDPSFMIVEGKFSYTATQAAAWGIDSSNPCQAEMLSTRKLHIRTVQKGGQIWASAQFFDANDVAHSCTVSSIDIFDVIATGFCENLADGESEFGAKPACSDITVSDYDSFWNSSLDYVSSDPTASFNFTPKSVSASEFCTPDGCTNI